MDRRRFLQAAATAMASGAAGCDRLVLLDPRESAELPPVTPTQRFYRYNYRARPELDPATHQMMVSYQGIELGSFGREFLDTLKPVETEQTLQCIGSSPRVQRISNAVWTGLPLREVLEARGIDVPSKAIQIRMTGMDEYHAAIPVTDLDDAPAWLMWGMNGEELPFAHGAPARLLVRGKYGMKAMKWIRELAFVDEPHESYWTERGWDEEAPYRPNTMIVNPIDGLVVERGSTVRFLGTAFAGEDPVVAVDVRIDGGAWEPAEVVYGPGAGIWVLWQYDWLAERGRHTLQVRCTTEGGQTSSEEPGGTDPLLGYDGSMQVMVRA